MAHVFLLESRYKTNEEMKNAIKVLDYDYSNGKHPSVHIPWGFTDHAGAIETVQTKVDKKSNQPHNT